LHFFLSRHSLIFGFLKSICPKYNEKAEILKIQPGLSYAQEPWSRFYIKLFFQLKVRRYTQTFIWKDLLNFIYLWFQTLTCRQTCMKPEAQLSTGLSIAWKTTDLIHILNSSSLVPSKFQISPKKIDIFLFFGRSNLQLGLIGDWKFECSAFSKWISGNAPHHGSYENQSICSYLDFEWCVCSI
jgi:hypothetical protein